MDLSRDNGRLAQARWLPHSGTVMGARRDVLPRHPHNSTCVRPSVMGIRVVWTYVWLQQKQKCIAVATEPCAKRFSAFTTATPPIAASHGSSATTDCECNPPTRPAGRPPRRAVLLICPPLREAERRFCAVGQPAWMPGEPCWARDGPSRRAHGAKPSFQLTSDAGYVPRVPVVLRCARSDAEYISIRCVTTFYGFRPYGGSLFPNAEKVTKKACPTIRPPRPGSVVPSLRHCHGHSRRLDIRVAPAKAKCIADVTEPYEKRFSANIQAAAQSCDRRQSCRAITSPFPDQSLHGNHVNLVGPKNGSQLPAVTKIVQHLREFLTLDRSIEPQQRVVPIDLIDTLGHHNL